MAAQRPVIALAGLGVALFLGLQILGTLKTLGPAPSSSAPSFAQAQPQPTVGSGTPDEDVQAIAPPVPGVKVSDPEMAARVLRSWMQEA